MFGGTLSASADIILFKNGTRMRGTITKRTPTEVIAELEFGSASFTPDEIVAVEAEVEAETPPPEVEPAAEDVAASEPPPGPAASSLAPEPAAAPQPSDQAMTLPEAMQAVAFIGVLYKDGTLGVGSGTIVNARGTMVTNAHVVANAERIAVAVPGKDAKIDLKKSRGHEARVLKADECYDLALISAPIKTPNYLRFADEEDEVKSGQEVRAIGNPQGLTISVSKGVVSAVRTMKEMGLEDPKVKACEHLSARTVEAFTLVQTDAAVNPGNSGGPLLNAKNCIVGINSFGFQEAGDAGLNFAVHVKHVKKFVGSYAKD